MKIERKDFLRGLGASALMLGLPRGANAAAAAPVKLPAWSAAQGAQFWDAVRAFYPITAKRVYFNTGGLGPASSRALAVMNRTAEQLQTDVETGHSLFAPARQVAAEFLGAATDEVCFTRNATEGNSIIAAGLSLRAGDEVIFETHAHPGGSFPWLNRQQVDGVKVRLFEPDPTNAESNVARIRALITPRTRVIQVSHITAPTGIILPVPEIAPLAHEHNLWFHVDGAQSMGMIPIDVRALGCDSYATSGHKWLGAPHETGLLFVRQTKLDQVKPVHVGAYSSGEEDPRHSSFDLVPNAQRYEYGTRNAAVVTAVAEAMAFQNEIGRDRIAQRGRELAARVRAGFAGIKGVEVLTPASPELSGSILTFRFDRIPYDKLFGRLLSEFHLRCRPVSEVGINALRVSTHVFNREDECDQLVRAMQRLASS